MSSIFIFFSGIPESYDKFHRHKSIFSYEKVNQPKILFFIYFSFLSRHFPFINSLGIDRRQRNMVGFFYILLPKKYFMDIDRFLSLIDDIIKNHISDLHFTTGEFPYIRNSVGDMTPVQAFGKLTEADIETITTHLVGRTLSLIELSIYLLSDFRHVFV